MNIKISDCISPNFHKIYKRLKNEIVTELWLRGGRGSTKSSFISLVIILWIIKFPQANGVVFRRFENEIRDSVFAQLQWATHTLGVDHFFKFQVSPFKIIYEPTGQMILFKGADNPKKIKSIKLATGYLMFAWFEEVDQFGGMEEIRNILQSIFRGTNETQTAFFSYNPPKSAKSWTNAETKIQKKGRIVHYSDYRDVPPEWLGETFLANAKHLKEVNEEAYKHEYLGEETGTGLEIFNNVTIRPISDKELIHFDHIYQGLDFGYAADPLAFVRFHFDAKKSKLYIFREITGIGLSNKAFVEQLSSDELNMLTLSDREPKSVDELHNDLGMNIVAADKPAGSVDYGTKWLQDLEEIIIDPVRCPLAAKEYVNYALEMNRFGDVISKFPDKDNHCFVGSTLISTLLGDKRIDEIRPGELVHTRQGLRQVNKVFRNGRKEVVTTKLLNGKSLTLTDTHDVITKEGKVKFKNLSSLDRVYYEVKGCRFIETENQKWQYLMAKNTDDIRRVRESQISHTSREPLKQGQMNISMWQFIPVFLGKSQMGITYTTKMGILLIMRFLIWNVLKGKNISVSIQKCIMGPIKKLLEKILIISGILQKPGMLLKKGMSGMLNMAKRFLRIGKKSPLNVNNVEKSSLRKPEQDFAQTSASQHGEEKKVLTMLKKSVQSVVRYLVRINMIRPKHAQKSVEEVFDLEIDGVHEYFANGLLVSNCIDATRYGSFLHISQSRAERKRSKVKVRDIPVLSRW